MDNHILQQLSTDIVDMISIPLVILDSELRVLAANDFFYRTFQVSSADIEQRNVSEVLNGQLNRPDLRAQLERTSREDFEVERIELTAQFPVIGERTLLLNARTIESQRRHGLLLLTFQDITAFSGRQAPPQADEAFYRTIFELARDILLLVDSQGNILDINPRAEVLTGYTQAELRRMNVFEDLIIPEDQAKMRQVLANVIAGQDQDYEVGWKAKDGSVIPFLGRSTARRSPSGEFLSTVCDLHSILHRRQAEEALRRSEERFRALIENSLDAIFLYSAEGTTLYASPSIRRINGFGPEEIVGKNRFDWIHPADLEQARNEWAALLQEPDKVISSLARGRHKDGSWLWIERIFHNLLDDPNVGAVVTNLRDVTEWKRTDEALRDSEAKFRGIFDTVHNVIVMVDKNGTILDVNDYVEKALGYTPPELRQRNVFDGLYVAEDRPFMKQVIADLVEGHDREYEVRWIAKDGHIVTFAGSSTSRHSPEGEFISTLCTYLDITDRKKAEEEVRQYTLRLETLLSIEQAILAARSLDEIVQAVLERIMKLVDCKEAHILLFDFEIREITIYAARSGGEGTLAPGTRVPFEDMGEALDDYLETLRSGEVALHGSVSTLSNANGSQNKLLRETHSAITAPLRVRGELIGAMNLWADQPDRFVAGNANIVREVADSLAIAVAQVHLFEEVSSARDRLQTLSHRLVETQEVERQRLSSELHDQVGQQLTSLVINLSVLRRELPARSAKKVKQRLSDSQRLLDDIFERIRNVMTDLRPAVLEDFGLAAALRWYAKQSAQRSGLKVTVQSPEEMTRLPPDVEITVFRIAQEALTNVSKHSHASEVALTFEIQEQKILLSIADNGVGFKLTRMRPQGRSRGFGLMIMQERAEAVGGHLQIETAPGTGTRIHVEIAR